MTREDTGYKSGSSVIAIINRDSGVGEPMMVRTATEVLVMVMTVVLMMVMMIVTTMLTMVKTAIEMLMMTVLMGEWGGVVVVLINGDICDVVGYDDGNGDVDDGGYDRKGDSNDTVSHKWWCLVCCGRQKAPGEMASAPLFLLQEKFFVPLSPHVAFETTN